MLSVYVAKLFSILVCIIQLQKLMLTSINYRYSNDSKKMESREMKIQGPAFLTLALTRTGHEGDLFIQSQKLWQALPLNFPQLRQEGISWRGQNDVSGGGYF